MSVEFRENIEFRNCIVDKKLFHQVKDVAITTQNWKKSQRQGAPVKYGLTVKTELITLSENSQRIKMMSKGS